jgi:hypothetical protein
VIGVSARKDVEMWIPGLRTVPDAWSGEAGERLIAPDVDAEAGAVLAWAKARGLRRVAVSAPRRPSESFVGDSTTDYSDRRFHRNMDDVFRKRLPASDLLFPPDDAADHPAGRLVEARPDLIVLDHRLGLVSELRSAGFGGPIFVSRYARAA